MKKHLVWLKFVVMAVLLAMLYRNVDFAKFKSALEGLQWGWIPLIYALFFLNTLISTVKWKELLAVDDVHVPLPNLLSSYLIATFFNLFMPSSIGGDAYRIVDTGKHSGSAKSFASVLADRLSGFLALAIWGLLFSAIGWSRLPDKRILWLPVLVFVLMGVMVFALVQRRMLVAVLHVFRIDHLTKFNAFIHRVLDSIARYHGDSRLMAKVFSLSMLFQILAITIIFSISKSLGWNVPYIYFCIFVPLITLGEALPISIFGIGVRDGLYVFFFTQVGATREQALSMALVYVLTTLLYSLAGGVLFLLRRPSASIST